MILQWFFASFAISASCHIAPQSQASQAKNLPQDAPLDPQRRAKEAQDGPRWAQDGPKMGSGRAGDNDEIPHLNSGSPPGIILGHPGPSKNIGFYNVFRHFAGFRPF